MDEALRAGFRIWSNERKKIIKVSALAQERNNIRFTSKFFATVKAFDRSRDMLRSLLDEDGNTSDQIKSRLQDFSRALQTHLLSKLYNYNDLETAYKAALKSAFASENSSAKNDLMEIYSVFDNLRRTLKKNKWQDEVLCCTNFTRSVSWLYECITVINEGGNAEILRASPSASDGEVTTPTSFVFLVCEDISAEHSAQLARFISSNPTACVVTPAEIAQTHLLPTHAIVNLVPNTGRGKVAHESSTSALGFMAGATLIMSSWLEHWESYSAPGMGGILPLMRQLKIDHIEPTGYQTGSSVQLRQRVVHFPGESTFPLRSFPRAELFKDVFVISFCDDPHADCLLKLGGAVVMVAPPDSELVTWEPPTVNAGITCVLLKRQSTRHAYNKALSAVPCISIDTILESVFAKCPLKVPLVVSKLAGQPPPASESGAVSSCAQAVAASRPSQAAESRTKPDSESTGTRSPSASTDVSSIQPVESSIPDSQMSAISCEADSEKPSAGVSLGDMRPAELQTEPSPQAAAPNKASATVISSEADSEKPSVGVSLDGMRPADFRTPPQRAAPDEASATASDDHRGELADDFMRATSLDSSEAEQSFETGPHSQPEMPVTSHHEHASGAGARPSGIAPYDSLGAPSELAPAASSTADDLRRSSRSKLPPAPPMETLSDWHPSRRSTKRSPAPGISRGRSSRDTGGTALGNDSIYRDTQIYPDDPIGIDKAVHELKLSSSIDTSESAITWTKHVAMQVVHWAVNSTDRTTPMSTNVWDLIQICARSQQTAAYMKELVGAIVAAWTGEWQGASDRKRARLMKHEAATATASAAAIAAAHLGNLRTQRLLGEVKRFVKLISDGAADVCVSAADTAPTTEWLPQSWRPPGSAPAELWKRAASKLLSKWTFTDTESLPSPLPNGHPHFFHIADELLAMAEFLSNFVSVPTVYRALNDEARNAILEVCEHSIRPGQHPLPHGGPANRKGTSVITVSMEHSAAEGDQEAIVHITRTTRATMDLNSALNDPDKAAKIGKTMSGTLTGSRQYLLLSGADFDKLTANDDDVARILRELRDACLEAQTYAFKLAGVQVTPNAACASVIIGDGMQIEHFDIVKQRSSIMMLTAGLPLRALSRVNPCIGMTHEEVLGRLQSLSGSRPRWNVGDCDGERVPHYHARLYAGASVQLLENSRPFNPASFPSAYMTLADGVVVSGFSAIMAPTTIHFGNGRADASDLVAGDVDGDYRKTLAARLTRINAGLAAEVERHGYKLPRIVFFCTVPDDFPATSEPVIVKNDDGDSTQNRPEVTCLRNGMPDALVLVHLSARHYGTDNLPDFSRGSGRAAATALLEETPKDVAAELLRLPNLSALIDGLPPRAAAVAAAFPAVYAEQPIISQQAREGVLIIREVLKKLEPKNTELDALVPRQLDAGASTSGNESGKKRSRGGAQ